MFVLYNTEIHKYMGYILNTPKFPSSPTVDLEGACLYTGLQDAKIDLEICYAAFSHVPDSWKLVPYDVALVLDS